METSSNNMIHTVDELVSRGNDHDVHLNEGKLSDMATNSSIKAPDISGDAAYDDYSERVPTKYGVQKVYKAEFNEDPDRYVLRKGFPDFPECPYGESFSMLGYDTHDKRYVWLVTSILKDERLHTDTYPDST